ncbi:MAG: hypothetical protein DHS20C01_09050 [marine bacterium B5-7]|nr:MAG: hypothetical protein DHS20C01_09050 [marine bacterium B5-7]
MIPRSEVVSFNYGLLRAMEWRRFEIVCAEYLRCLGHEVMEERFPRVDAVGINILSSGSSRLFSVSGCVATGEPVDGSYISAFVKTMEKRRVIEGMVFSVCGFTTRAARFAERHRIAVVDGELLCSRVNTFDLQMRTAMIDVATDADYTTPTCPTCGIKMVLRRKAGSKPGQGEFWGCMNYPRCRHIMTFG